MENNDKHAKPFVYAPVPISQAVETIFGHPLSTFSFGLLLSELASKKQLLYRKSTFFPHIAFERQSGENG